MTEKRYFPSGRVYWQIADPAGEVISKHDTPIIPPPGHTLSRVEDYRDYDEMWDEYLATFMKAYDEAVKKIREG